MKFRVQKKFVSNTTDQVVQIRGALNKPKAIGLT